MKELLDDHNDNSITSQQKNNVITKRAMKKSLSKYNFKEVDSGPSRKEGPRSLGSHSLAALHLFQTKHK